MDLDQQIQDLIDNTPDEGELPAAMVAIAPALKQIASQVKHLQYYILQTLDGQWAMSTLSQNTQPQTTRNVIHAYPTLKDTASGPYPVKDPQIIALPIPITHILFQMLAMPMIDSVIFFEIPGNLNTGTEVRRQDIYNLMQVYLQQMPAQAPLPPDIA